MRRVQLRTPATTVWRAPGVLQVGLDAPAIVLEGVPDQLSDAVELLARPNTPDELATLLPALDVRWISWLLAQLEAAGLLAGPADAPPEVTVVGSGALAEAVHASLATDTVSAVLLPPASFVATGPDRPEAGGPGLTVLAGPSPEPDRSLTDSLFRSGRPHLVVRLEAERAVVGPLVVPGRTPCVRCLDLSRCRLDPAWPQLLAQLCLDRVRAEPSLLAWAASTAMVQARAWLAGRLPETGGSSLELALADYQLTSRSWPAHPRCGCLLPIG